MLVGHYGVSFLAKKSDDSIPLWVLFVAVQLLDVVWAPLVLLGVEKVRIVPGFTATNPLDLYYMPYTHSLAAALLWSLAGAVTYRLLRRSYSPRASLLVGPPSSPTGSSTSWSIAPICPCSTIPPRWDWGFGTTPSRLSASRRPRCSGAWRSSFATGPVAGYRWPSL